LIPIEQDRGANRRFFSYGEAQPPVMIAILSPSSFMGFAPVREFEIVGNGRRYALWPPSNAIVLPVSNRSLGRARNATADATSAVRRSQRAAQSTIVGIIAVSIPSNCTTFTGIFFGPRSHSHPVAISDDGGLGFGIVSLSGWSTAPATNSSTLHRSTRICHAELRRSSVCSRRWKNRREV
jgi:hypothetical protein